MHNVTGLCYKCKEKLDSEIEMGKFYCSNCGQSYYCWFNIKTEIYEIDILNEN